MAKPVFVKRVIGELANPQGGGAMNTLIAIGDINGDGRPDAAVSGRNGTMAWFENPGDAGPWRRHPIDEVTCQECGGQLWDLTGSGRLDLVNGSDGSDIDIFWWENPGRPGARWTKRIIATTGIKQFHDTIIGDVTGDGIVSLAFTNQKGPGGTTIFRVPVPKDPRQSPWPGLEVVAEGKSETNPGAPNGLQPEEGIAIGDVDGDGRNELVAGTHWYKRVNGRWIGHKFAEGYITTKIVVADVDGDGRGEILLSEGDPCVYGKNQGGRAGWFKAGRDPTARWTEHVLEDGLLDAHSLQVGDICGNGRADILVGEVGVGEWPSRKYLRRPPRILVFENDGRGGFHRHVVDEGTGCHDARLVDTRGRGVLDIVTKPLHGPEIWNIHVYERQR
jgi:hypothetical protein